MSEPRIWTINGDFTTLKPTGLARYARGVTLALDAMISERDPLTSDLDVRIVAPRPVNDLALANIPITVVPEFNKPRLPQFWVQCQLPFHVKGNLISFCNLGPVAVKQQIACIHDLHTLIAPESYSFGFRMMHRLVLPLLGARAAAITTVSNVSRDQLAEFGVAPPEKVTVTYNGGDHARAWDPGRSAIELPERPYVLGLGQPQAYKNAGLFWKIAKDLDRMGLDLVIAGGLAPDVAASFGPQPSNMRMTGRVSDDDLARLLTNALCFAFPSRLEGFGIPVVEALAWNCPVVASSIPCMHEICEDAALFADPDQPQAWVAAIAQIQSKPELAATLRQRGFARFQKFSWRNVATAYLRLMQQMDSVAAPHSASNPALRLGRSGQP